MRKTEKIPDFRVTTAYTIYVSIPIFRTRVATRLPWYSRFVQTTLRIRWSLFQILTAVPSCRLSSQDAMIINKSSYERGFGHGSLYKTAVFDIDLEEENNGR